MPHKLPNRWLIAAAAISIQICCGAIYSWSVFVKPLTASEPWSLVQVSATFTISLAFIGIGALVGGMWQDRVGPRVVATVAGLVYGLGFLVAGFSVAHHSLIGLWIGYGPMAGLGIGMSYICPLAAVAKWFPDRRGLMIGATVMGYGAGAVVMSPIAARLITHEGVPATFTIFGLAYMAIIVTAAQMHVNPPMRWCPDGWEPRSNVAKMASKVDYTVGQAIRTWRFWLLWLILTLNTSAGIMIISQASPLAQQQVGMTVLEASAVVGIISIFNALGRIGCSALSDIVGRSQVFFGLYIVQVVVFFTLPRLHDPILFQIAVCAIALCYGGGFAVSPSFATDFFGARYIGGIFGWMTCATWVVAAIPSPLLIAKVRESTGSYGPAITVIGFVMLLALPLPLLAGRAAAKVAEEQVLEGAPEAL